MSSLTHYLLQIPAAILSFEFLLGGQCRVTHLFTPSLHERVMRKAEGTAEALYPIIPVKDPKRNTQVVGAMMCVAGVLWAWKGSRGSVGTLMLSEFLTGAGVYSQCRMGIPYWLPVVNSFLGALVFSIERKQSGLL